MTEAKGIGPCLSEAATYASEAHRFLVAASVRLNEAELGAPGIDQSGAAKQLAYLLHGTNDLVKDLRTIAGEYGHAEVQRRARKHG